MALDTVKKIQKRDLFAAACCFKSDMYICGYMCVYVSLCVWVCAQVRACTHVHEESEKERERERERELYIHENLENSTIVLLVVSCNKYI